MAWLEHILFISILSLKFVNAQQSCLNFGLNDNGSCLCPPGFGGPTCSQLACGGDIFQGSKRPLAQEQGTPPASNLTASGCSCESGWQGLGCNVCQNAGACQSGYANSGSNNQSAGASAVPGLNSTLTCNTSPRVYSSNQMTCQVINPTLQALFSGSTNLNIMRTLDPSLTPIPNVTAFGTHGSMTASLFYNGVEQFYCRASSCNQTLSSSSNASSDWNCQTLECMCRPGTTFCGGVPSANLTSVLNELDGPVEVSCQPGSSSGGDTTCAFKQSVLQSLFGTGGLSLTGCQFGECVRQNVIDSSSSSSSAVGSKKKELGGGVVAGLAVVGALLFLAFVAFLLGLVQQRRARRRGLGWEGKEKSGGVEVRWEEISYLIPADKGAFRNLRNRYGNGKSAGYLEDGKVILDRVSGVVKPGEIMAILGPSGAGKTTLIEILAGKSKSGTATGVLSFPTGPSPLTRPPKIGFVPQQDILPPTLTVREALLFAARLRLPESIPLSEKVARVDEVLEKLGLGAIADGRIGEVNSGGGGGGRGRGISGGEMRRVSIGLELVARPDVLILDEPTSGLDSVSAARVARVLRDVAHDAENPTAVIASIHQPSSQLYQIFDKVLLLAHGCSLYCGPGGFAPVDHFNTVSSQPGARLGSDVPQVRMQPYQKGYNVADYLLEVASDPPLVLFDREAKLRANSSSSDLGGNEMGGKMSTSKEADAYVLHEMNHRVRTGPVAEKSRVKMRVGKEMGGGCQATFLTQIEVLSGREWKVLRRDKSLFFAHLLVASFLGVFCGGLYFRTDFTIAGFQSRVGCLFFIGALVAFSTLSALYNIVVIRPLFVRERSSAYYSPTTWLLSRFAFDVLPLRIIPSIIVGTITYWMAGLAKDAAHFFKFLFVLVLFTLCMTLYNFLLGTVFHNGGISILLSALSALYQMTFAGFFVHLKNIPPVLRWLQWICPLKYTLEALSVNEVGSGLMINDVLQGVPVSVSASLIMKLLFGFSDDAYYRDVLVLFGFIAFFALGVIGVVWLRVRERR